MANEQDRMLCANLCLVVFLALKNTPLAILSAYSYERLNGLHQIAGYTTIGYLVLHASMYSRYFLAQGMTSVFENDSVKAGIVAGFALLGVFLSAAIIRHVRYEVFYVFHIVCFMIALTSASFHQPDIAENGLLTMLLLVASMWSADRLFRGSRLLLRATSTHAILEPLPQGGTKVILSKKPHGAVAGKHCFVWIPGVRLFETHPFTIAATQPIEFVVNANDGFTRDLHRYAVANPGARLRASIDGPYGTFPDPMAYDKVVLIAGGSGATFTFGLAVNMLERMGPNSTKRIVFIWAIKKRGKLICYPLASTWISLRPCLYGNRAGHTREKSPLCERLGIHQMQHSTLHISLSHADSSSTTHADNLAWFANHLHTLKTHPHAPRVSVSLYVTTAASPDSIAETPTQESSDGEQQDNARDVARRVLSITTTVHSDKTAGGDETPQHVVAETKSPTTPTDPEKGMVLTTNSVRRDSEDSGSGIHEILTGRPDAAALVREAVAATGRDQRVLVAACGPVSLMQVVRNTTASLITGDGPGVELHCEQFGW